MNEVIVYGADWCSYCQSLEDKLEALGVEYVSRDVDDEEVRSEMNAKTSGNQTIPVLFIGDNFWVNPGVDVLSKQFRDKQGSRKYA